MSATVPTKDAFDALEARVKALEQGQAPTPPNPQPPDPKPPEPDPGPPGERPTNPGAPALPAKPAAMPGTSGRVLTAGPGQQHVTVAAAIAAAQHGDTIQLASNTPRETFVLDKNILLDGSGVRWDFTGTSMNDLAQRKAGIVPTSQAWHIRNFTILGCGRAERSAQLCAGIRFSGPPATQSWGVVENCTLNGNQNGFAADGARWVIELIDVNMNDNGLGDGLTHNLYVNDGHTLILKNVQSFNPRGAHAIKSRAWHTFVEGGTFSANETPLDLPNGGVFTVKGTTFRKTNNPNRRFLSYAVENKNCGTLDTNRLDTCVFDLQVNDPFVQSNGGTITFAPDCQWTIRQGKAGVQGSGGRVIGLPP